MPKYNSRPTDPLEAVVALSIGQSVTPTGGIKVTHYNETQEGLVDQHHIKAKNVEELRKTLHQLVEDYIGYYVDRINGV